MRTSHHAPATPPATATRPTVHESGTAHAAQQRFHVDTARSATCSTRLSAPQSCLRGLRRLTRAVRVLPARQASRRGRCTANQQRQPVRAARRLGPLWLPHLRWDRARPRTSAPDSRWAHPMRFSIPRPSQPARPLKKSFSAIVSSTTLCSSTARPAAPRRTGDVPCLGTHKRLRQTGPRLMRTGAHAREGHACAAAVGVGRSVWWMGVGLA